MNDSFFTGQLRIVTQNTWFLDVEDNVRDIDEGESIIIFEKKMRWRTPYFQVLTSFGLRLMREDEINLHTKC